MQYVSRYINHKHGIKTARDVCPARGVGGGFLRAAHSASPSRRSQSLTLYENRGTRISYPLTLRLMPKSICDASGGNQLTRIL